MVFFRLRMTYKQSSLPAQYMYFFCVLTVLLDRWLVTSPPNMDHMFSDFYLFIYLFIYFSDEAFGVLAYASCARAPSERHREELTTACTPRFPFAAAACARTFSTLTTSWPASTSMAPKSAREAGQPPDRPRGSLAHAPARSIMYQHYLRRRLATCTSSSSALQAASFKAMISALL